MVFRPILPAKAGYVEVLNENGQHVYKATAEKLEEIRRNDLISDLEYTNASLTESVVDLEYRMILSELGLTEADI